ncbi:50S ribosomal protein L25/general stress protein Ctc [Bacillaceae bacterium W0354]
MATTIKAKDRKDLRKSHTKYLRNNGFIPAVVYGKGKEPVTVAVNSIELVKKVRDEGRNAVFSLEIEGGKALNVLLYDYQNDDIKDELIHADFYQVDMSTEVDVEVNVQLEGEAKGEKDGGIKQQTLYTINVRTTPNNIPEAITVDISDLGIGDTITVGDIKTSNDYAILDDDASTIVTIVAPQQTESTEDVDEAPQEEPATDGNEE